MADDQSNPRVTVQLVQGLLAKHVPVILGPSGPDACAAATPLLAQNGPVLYCLSPTAQAQPGGYVFLTQFSGESGMAVDVRYLRERGLRKIAFITSTDATGQDAERALNAVLAPPRKRDRADRNAPALRVRPISASRRRWPRSKPRTPTR